MPSDALTVVIPTRNRPRYVQRLLEYLAAGGHRSRVLIADSSSDAPGETKAAALRTQAGFPVQYRAWTTETPLFEKCFEALTLVETPLVALLADDDFVVPSTLAAAAARLEADPSIACAHGAAMSLSLDTGPGIDAMSTVRSRSRKHLVALQDSAVERITHWLRNYASIYYSVMRTPQLVAAFRHLVELKLDYDFGQLLTGCLTLAEGKAAAVDGLYYVVMDTAIGASRSPHALIPGWRKLLTQPDYSQRYGQFKALVLDALPSSLPRDQAGQELDSAFVDYVMDRLRPSRVGELERLKRTAHEAGTSVARLAAIAKRGVRTLVEHPAAVTELGSPRLAFGRWARALDPMSIEALREGREAANIRQVLESIASYPG